MISRLVHTADFRRLLATVPRSRSAHFALHHVAAASLQRTKPPGSSQPEDLSTGTDQAQAISVDNSAASALVGGLWVGVVVPKRHARRAVTRSLIKRQSFDAARRHGPSLAPGLWLVRLRAGYPVAQFPSASSKALRLAVQAELEALFLRAAR